MPTRFNLGDRVTFTDTVSKERSSVGVEWHRRGLPTRAVDSMDENRAWQREERPFTEGIVIGARTLSEYSIEHETEYGEYGVSYGTYTVIGCIPGTGKKAWLVSYNMRRKPVLVLDDDITLVGKTE